MVLIGIQKRGHSCPVECALDYGADISREQGIPRSSAGFVALKDRLESSIVVIGNTPSALLTVCGFVDEGITAGADCGDVGRVCECGGVKGGSSYEGCSVGLQCWYPRRYAGGGCVAE